MGILPSAPKIELRAASQLYAGSTVRFEIRVTVDEPTNIDGITLAICGTEGYDAYEGVGSYVTTYPDLEASVRGPGVLATGTSEYSVEAALPANMAPSHEVSPGFARLEVTVRIAIPWWPDRRSRFTLPVRLPPPAEVIRTPVAVTTEPGHVAADEPRLELGLASTRWLVGEIIRGTCALFHVDDRATREVELSLVPVIEGFADGGAQVSRGTPVAYGLTIPTFGSGKHIDFAVPLPSTIAPSFRSVSHALNWLFVARYRELLGAKLELTVPIAIFDASAERVAEPLRASPPLGDRRVSALFEAFARDAGWRLDMRDRSGGEPTLRRQVDDLELAIDYAYRADEGTFIVSRVRYPRLGIQLLVAPGTSLRNAVFQDIESGHRGWDREHRVSATSAAQAAPLLRAVVPILASASELGALKTWSDEDIVFERRVGTLKPTDLTGISMDVQRVAHAIAAASNALLPPPGLGVDIAQWRVLAERLHGRLVVGDLSIDGRTDQLPVSIRLRRDRGAPSAIRVSVGDTATAGPIARETNLDFTNPAADAPADSRAERIAAQLARWPADVTRLEIANGSASAHLPISAAADTSRIRDLVRDLRTVLAALDAGIGPYR